MTSSRKESPGALLARRWKLAQSRGVRGKDYTEDPKCHGECGGLNRGAHRCRACAHFAGEDASGYRDEMLRGMKGRQEEA